MRESMVISRLDATVLGCSGCLYIHTSKFLGEQIGKRKCDRMENSIRGGVVIWRAA